MTHSPTPRICVVAHSAELYGADRCLHAALPELVGVAAVTIAVPGDGPGVEIMRALGAHVLVLPDYAIRRRHIAPKGLLPWLVRIRSAIKTLAAEHRRAPFDVVYSNTLAAGIGPILRRRWSVPHAVHVHECPSEPSWLPRILLAMLSRGSDLAICNSHYTANWVCSHRPDMAGRTVVVHNGLDLVPSPLQPRVRTGSLNIACVARIHPKKGHPVLFEATRDAVLAGRNWTLHLFGDTLDEHLPIRAALVQYAADNGFAERVIWHGFVDDVQQQYAEADIAVVPSVVPEEFSLVCLEAQSMMVPVVATGPGGASEVVLDGVTGMIVAPDNSPALYVALCALDDDPELAATMGRAGRTRSETAFSRSAFANGVTDHLLRLTPSRVRAAQ